MKKIVMTGITAMIFGSAFLQTEEGFAYQSDAPNVEIIQMQDHITDELVVKKVSEWMMMDSYISKGGDYKEDEYKTFKYKNQTYRYLSKDIDTKKELIGYLKTSLTIGYAEQYIRNKGIIVHKGKLAQLEADGGSLLQWNHAVVTYDSTTGSERIYTLTVPIGDTEQNETYHVSFRFDGRKDWKSEGIRSLQEAMRSSRSSSLFSRAGNIEIYCAILGVSEKLGRIPCGCMELNINKSPAFWIIFVGS